MTRLLIAPLALLLVQPLLAEHPAGQAPAGYAAKEAAWAARQELVKASLFNHLTWRSVGPTVQGGRVVDLEAVPGKPYTFYVAYASGGLWRTETNGVTFEPLFDEQPTLIMGDIAVDPQNPATIWVGTGENNSSRSSYPGLGVYRSDDAGKTWRHMGLGESDRIGRIIVDPRDSRRVWVAVLGRLYTSSPERGVYRTTDGGATWQRVLATGQEDGETGVIDLAIDPQNSDILYAAAWQRSRRPWNFVEGGKGSGIYKSVDGGTTWSRLTAGLPTGEHVGRIGLAIAPSRPSTLYASVDNQEPLPEELWDLGDAALSAKRLKKMTKEEFLAQDPEAIEDFIRDNELEVGLDAKSLIKKVKNDEVTLADLLAQLDDANANLFDADIRGLEVYRSDDAGASWRRTHEGLLRDVTYTYGYYFGQVRVAPEDPEKVYCVGVPLIGSEDGGKTWRGKNGRGVHVDYHPILFDPNAPGRMIAGNDGGLDASYDGGKTWVKLDNQAVGQFYSIAYDFDEPYNVYGGLQDNGTLKGSSQARPGIDPWTFLGGGDGMHVQIDPRDGTYYFGSQFGFYYRQDPSGPRRSVRPRNALKEKALRYNWNSPVQLSSHNPDIVYFGTNKLFRSLDQGETWKAISPELTVATDHGDVPFATITSISESTLELGLIWVGTDDGQVHLTVDGGVSWKDVGSSLPQRWVSRLEASRQEKGRAYLSLNGYRDDDHAPYLYMTEDFGATWISIAGKLPAEPINVVREDPQNSDVLYVGTDRGVYVSLDRGGSWQALAAGLPPVAVHDLAVHPRDRELIAGTHGRSIYILDALPIQEAAKLLKQPEPPGVDLYPVEKITYDRGWASRRSLWFYDATEDPFLKIPFWSAADGRATLTVLEGERPLRRFEVETQRGINTLTWDLLLDEKLALAAEQAKLADANKPAESKKKKIKPAETAVTTEGEKAKTPWAEALRLERPLYITPGKYRFKVEVGAASDVIELEVSAPSARPARQKAKMKVRGVDDEVKEK